MVMQDYEEQYRKAYEAKVYTGETGNFLAQSVVRDLSLLMRKLRAEKKRLFFVGNGGSAGISVHMTADFLKNGKMRTVD